MPAVERGWWLLDSRVIVGLDAGRLRGLAEWALALGEAVLVTRPGVVVVEGCPGRCQVAAGVGSLIAPAEPPVGGALRLARREWVDGCRVSGEPRVERARGAPAAGEGVVVALDPSDPAALFVNGVRGRVEARLGGVGALAALDGPGGVPVLSAGEGGGYVVNAVSGRAAELLGYIAPLSSACWRGP